MAKEKFECWTDKKRNPFNWIVGEPDIGEDAWIGPFTVIDGSGGLKIGKETIVSAGAHVYTHENKSRHEIVRKPTTIGRGVYIGANAVVMMGCKIGDGATIGAGAVVLKNTIIQKGEVWAGVPAKKIKTA